MVWRQEAGDQKVPYIKPESQNQVRGGTGGWVGGHVHPADIAAAAATSRLAVALAVAGRTEDKNYTARLVVLEYSSPQAVDIYVCHLPISLTFSQSSNRRSRQHASKSTFAPSHLTVGKAHVIHSGLPKDQTE